MQQKYGRSTKALYVTALVKVLIPFIVVLPGVVAFKLYGPLGDASYGKIVDDLLPPWLSGAFAAAMVGAVLSSFNSCLNAASALYTCDIHQAYFSKKISHRSLGTKSSLVFASLSIALVPYFENSKSIIALLQKLNGLYSMPVLSAFLCALFFKGVKASALKLGMLCAFIYYGLCVFAQTPWFLWGSFSLPHYIHQMFFTLFLSLFVTLSLSYAFRPARDLEESRV